MYCIKASSLFMLKQTFKYSGYFQMKQQITFICTDGSTEFLHSHIKEHLKDEIDVKDENLNDEDLQFHYFKLHDSDNNNKLDGIELINALTHYHDDENNKNGEQKTYNDEEIAAMIDQILEEDDKNKDGYIDYAEFAASQKT